MQSVPITTKSCEFESCSWRCILDTTLVMTGTNCTGSCKSNYHTITTTTDPVMSVSCCSIYIQLSIVLIGGLLLNSKVRNVSTISRKVTVFDGGNHSVYFVLD
jgi:hypothetical protein